jgi:hypothetical protein
MLLGIKKQITFNLSSEQTLKVLTASKVGKMSKFILSSLNF